VAAEVIHRLFDPLLDAAPGHGAGLDWKTSLQELTAERGLGVPEYRITSDGPDHAKSFTAAAVIGNQVFDVRPGRNKKEAEQAAAEAAWRALSNASIPADPHVSGNGVASGDETASRNETVSRNGFASGDAAASADDSEDDSRHA